MNEAWYAVQIEALGLWTPDEDETPDYVGWEDERAAYRVWPDDTKQPVSDGEAYAWKSDDYLTVSLTDEQADVMTYDDIAAALKAATL